MQRNSSRFLKKWEFKHFLLLNHQMILKGRLQFFRDHKCFILYFYESWNKTYCWSFRAYLCEYKNYSLEFLKNKLIMNYQLLIESYSFWTFLSEQELEPLRLDFETKIMNINISTYFECFKSAPFHICEGLNFKKNTYLDYVLCWNIRFI